MPTGSRSIGETGDHPPQVVADACPGDRKRANVDDDPHSDTASAAARRALTTIPVRRARHAVAARL